MEPFLGRKRPVRVFFGAVGNSRPWLHGQNTPDFWETIGTEVKGLLGCGDMLDDSYRVLRSLSRATAGQQHLVA